MVVPLDLEMPLRASVRPTAVGVELVRLKGESTSEQLSSTDMRTEMEGKSYIAWPMDPLRQNPSDRAPA